ncbi:hypothetical protein PTKIN_Ptkin16aG0520600 [Pterospermum kingtungense]
MEISKPVKLRKISKWTKSNQEDIELIGYLKKKVDKKPLPPNRIWEVQLYNYDPHTLTEMNENVPSNEEVKEWYFFTPRYRKYKNGSRPDRRAGDGFWKATGACRDIEYKGKVVGSKKTLEFYWGKQPRGDKTNWIMLEYVLNDDTPARESANYKGDMLIDEWVLCKVYKKDKDAKSRLAPTQKIDTEMSKLKLQ